MKSLKLHRIGFYRPEQPAIQCMAFDGDRFLACGRANGRIDLFCVGDERVSYLKSWHNEPGISVESLRWLRGRLYTAGFDGAVYAYDIQGTVPVQKLPVLPNPIWCMDAGTSGDDGVLVIGTEAGTVFGISVDSEGQMLYTENITKLPDRVLSLALSHSLDLLAIGSIDNLRLIDFRTKKLLHQITMPREQRTSPTSLWAVAFTGNDTLACGDSTGKTSFWDSKTGVLISEFKSHLADVTSLCVSQDGSTLYSSGIDPALVRFEPTQTGFALGQKVTNHKHDVRSLAWAKGGVLSAGVDTFLGYTFSHPLRNTLQPTFISDHIQISEFDNSNLVLLQYEEFLELWTLGASDANVDDTTQDGRALPLVSKPTKTLQLRAKTPIRCCGLSREYVAFSTAHGLKIYKIEITLSASQIMRAEGSKVILSETIQNPSHLVFLTHTGSLLATGHKRLFLLQIRGQLANLEQEWTFEELGIVGGVTRLACSRDNTTVAIGTTEGRVLIFSLALGQVTGALPQPSAALVDCSFGGDNTILALYADGKVTEHTLPTLSLSPFAKSYLLSPHLKLPFGLAQTPTGLAADALASVYVYSEGKLVRLGRGEHPPNFEPAAVERLRHLVKFGVAAGVAIAVQVDPATFFDSLPPPLKVKKFGTG